MIFIPKKKYINIKLKNNYIKYLIILQIYSVSYINYKIINKKFNQLHLKNKIL